MVHGDLDGDTRLSGVFHFDSGANGQLMLIEPARCDTGAPGGEATRQNPRAPLTQPNGEQTKPSETGGGQMN